MAGRELTRRALAAKKARGERAGTVPYGFSADADGHLTPNPAEQVVIEQVRELRANGVSIRGIVSALAALGFVSRSGRPFCKASVENLLKKQPAA